MFFISYLQFKRDHFQFLYILYTCIPTIIYRNKTEKGNLSSQAIQKFNTTYTLAF